MTAQQREAESSSHHDQIEFDEVFAEIGLEPEMRRRMLEWDDLWYADGLLANCTVRLNRRLTRSIGLCRPSKRLIDLNQLLLHDENRQLLFETLCHEAAHLVVHTRLGRTSRPHGREWKVLMRSAGFQARAHIPSDQIKGDLVPSRRVLYEYEHCCSHCGATMLSRRTSYRWRCAACVNKGLEGHLDVTRRKIQ